jgi:hypothetical protein
VITITHRSNLAQARDRTKLRALLGRVSNPPQHAGLSLGRSRISGAPLRAGASEVSEDAWMRSRCAASGTHGRVMLA